MKKEKLMFGLFAFTIALFSIIIISNVISAADPNDLAKSAVEGISKAITEWFAGIVNNQLSKVLFGILLALLIYSILDFSGIINQNLIKVSISVIVSFLSIAYLTPTEIWLILASYNAMGATLLTLIPIMILMLFSYRMILVGGAKGVIFQYLIWIFYGIFLTIKILIQIFGEGWFTNGIVGVLYIVGLIITLIAIFFNKPIRTWLGSEYLNEEIRDAKETFERARVAKDELAEFVPKEK